jgi:threonyl-tRNA synthetase
MKIVTLHCDYIRFKALKKALKVAEELKEKGEIEVKEPLVVLTAIEKGDNKKTLEEFSEAVKKTANEVKVTNIVLYPYAHLSSNLASPKEAQEALKEAEKSLKKEFKVQMAPFGYYKSFELKVKGHPLSELSKEFKSSSESESGELKEENYSPEKLLKEISRAKLDTSKLRDNDHRILGQNLDLFSFNEVSPGSVFWHHNGWTIYKELINFLRPLLRKFDYEEIATPQIFNNNLWKVSGHWEHYRNNMFLTKYEKREFSAKPMNCPGCMLVYKTKPRSHKDLPLRLAEFGVVHRKELSGVLAGLFRVIRFTQDDALIFCTNKQLANEMKNLFRLVDIIYKDTFGFNYSLELSTRPKKYLGDKKDWDYKEKVLEEALKKAKVKYKINKGDGAFYGPKIDLHIKDSLGRSWQCATIQLDMQMPKRFGLTYTDEKGKKQTPLLVHRALFGSLERFIGILLEHLNGSLPLWLSPRQVRVINFTERNKTACEKFIKELKEEIPDIRLEADFRSETVQSKIRNSEMMKTNYTIVIGDKEEESNTLAVRSKGKKPKFGIKKSDLIKKLKLEILEPNIRLKDTKNL